MSRAAQDVIAERERQQTVEGWTHEHDDKHTDGEMAQAAACYALARRAVSCDGLPMWPWNRWWKPKDRRRDLVRAGALILAEIERLDRAAGIPLPTAQPDPGRGEKEIRAEIARKSVALAVRVDRRPRLDDYRNGYVAALRWVLNEQETGR